MENIQTYLILLLMLSVPLGIGIYLWRKHRNKKGKYISEAQKRMEALVGLLLLLYIITGVVSEVMHWDSFILRLLSLVETIIIYFALKRYIAKKKAKSN